MHRSRATWARHGLGIAAALWLGCAGNDDVVATAVDVAVDSPSAGSFTVVDPGTAGAASAVGGGTLQAGAPAVGGSMVTAPSVSPAPAPPFVLPAGAVLVSGAPRPIPIGDAEPWPFPELLRDVFGTPTPNAPAPARIEADPIRAEELRRLGDNYGFEPGVAAAMLVVVDDDDEQYDISIWEP